MKGQTLTRGQPKGRETRRRRDCGFVLYNVIPTAFSHSGPVGCLSAASRVTSTDAFGGGGRIRTCGLHLMRVTGTTRLPYPTKCYGLLIALPDGSRCAGQSAPFAQQDYAVRSSWGVTIGGAAGFLPDERSAGHACPAPQVRQQEV